MGSKRFSDDQIFVENSTYPRHRLKKRFLELVPYKCVECPQEGIWNGKPLSLQLDHINGVNDDNKMDNLRLLCPNCHTQQDTYCSKNWRNDKRKPTRGYISV